MQFDSLDDIKAFCRDLPEGDARSADAAALAQQALPKPPGALARLEELAVWLARWQRHEIPKLDRVTIAVFAGNHGVAARGVSAYPPAARTRSRAAARSKYAARRSLRRGRRDSLAARGTRLSRRDGNLAEAGVSSADK